MTKVNITGTIVGADYDSWWFRDAIESGALTVSSRKCYEIGACADDLHLYINSFGGYVNEALTIVNAVRMWSAEHPGKSLDITVGALAASAAANMVVQLMDIASSVRCYPESEFMFHSAASFVEGGPEAMKDAAEHLEAINKGVMDALEKKCGFEKDEIAEWFAEGRMGWITAEKAFSAGLVTEIIGAECPGEPEKLDESKAAPKAVASLYRITAHRAIKNEDTTMNRNNENPDGKPQETQAEVQAEDVRAEVQAEDVRAEVQAEDAAKAAEQAERKRATDIMRICVKFGQAELAARAIAEGLAVEQVKDELLKIAEASLGTTRLQEEPKAAEPEKPEVNPNRSKIFAAFGVKAN